MSLIRAGLHMLESRRDRLCKRFFQCGVLPENVLHYLLPDKRDLSVTVRLHYQRNFETLQSRTIKFQNSLISIFLNSLSLGFDFVCCCCWFCFVEHWFYV